jgi:hypothetical protein
MTNPSVPPPSAIGKVGGKRFTTTAEPPVRLSASAGARLKGSVMGGVKRLFRAAMQPGSPRAGSPLRQARRELDEGYERFLKTMLEPDNVYGPRAIAALAGLLQAERAYSAAGRRQAALLTDADAAAYQPPLDAFTFTELLSLRQRLPQVAVPDPHCAAVLAFARRAIEQELSHRERPFRAVLVLLLDSTPSRCELDPALRALAVAVSRRERYGEHPARFLGGLAGRLANEEIAAIAAALAAPSIRTWQALPAHSGGHTSIAISAPDGGAQACARLLKEAVDTCMRSRLVVRARLAFKHGLENARPPALVVQAVLKDLLHGAAAIQGQAVPHDAALSGQAAALFAKALAGDGSVDVRPYTGVLEPAQLEAFEEHLPALTSARRRQVQQAIDSARRSRAHGASMPQAQATAGCLAMESISMQAARIIARLLARRRGEQGPHGPHGPHPEPALASRCTGRFGMQTLKRMSLNITPQANGDFDVSVITQLQPGAGDKPVSLTYTARIAADARTLKGAFRHQR